MLTIALLGPPRVEVDGVPLQVDTRKATALLAYLAVGAQAHGRDRLADLFWPASDPGRSRAALRRTLSTLNAALGDRWLRTRRDLVDLDRQDVWLDVSVFEQLCSRDDPAALEQAASVYRGEFLAGFSLKDAPDFDDWQRHTAERLQREHARALERLVGARVESGHLEAAIEAAQRWLALDRLNEPAHRRLMLLHARRGDRSAAQRQYRECVATLDRELGVEPLEETVALHEAILEGRLPRASSASPRPADRPRPGAPPMVGRADELDRLTELHRDAVEGRLAVVAGEAGIGKTRLVEELASEVTGLGGAVVASRCYPDQRHVAYAPIAEALRRALAVAEDTITHVSRHWLAEVARLVPEVTELRPDLQAAGALETAGAQVRFLHGLCRVLESACAGPVPGLIVVEDLHWADDASIDVLAYLARRLEGHPILLCLTWRTEDVGHRVRPFVAAAGALVLELGRLGHDDVVELARAVGRPARIGTRVFEESEGLPFFVAQYLEALPPDAGSASSASSAGEDPWPLPAGVKDLLEARLSPLTGPARQVLTTAAVVGRSFDLGTLHAAGRTEDETVAALEELVGAGLLTERAEGPGNEPRYDFAHDKLREFVYDQTGLARRRLLHARVAETLGRSQKRADAAAAGHHYRMAGADGVAADRYRIAGDDARRLFANAEALVHYASALALGHPDVAGLHEATGDLRTLRGEYAQARSAYEAAAAHTSEATHRATIERKIAAVHMRLGDWEAADAHLAAALETIDPGQSPGDVARIYADRSLAAHRRDLGGEAAGLARRALSAAEAAGDRVALAQAHNIMGMLARANGRPDEAHVQLERSLELAAELPDPTARVAALNNLALTLGEAGEVEAALRHARTALGVCAAQGDRHREAALHSNIADLLHAAGRTEDAMSHLKEAAAIFAEIGAPHAAEGAAEIWKLTEW